MSLPADFVNRFVIESWSLYSTGIAVICLRMGVQYWKLKRLQADDYIMMFSACWYTLLCVSLNNIVGGGGSNFMSPADVAALTPEITKHRIMGAKWVFVSEQALMATIWTMKGCMLIVYGRLTSGLKQRKYIVWLTVYTYVGYVIVQICYFSVCRPFTDYFAVPNPPGQEQCASYLDVLIVQGCFNITSDIGMLLVGIPLLIMVKIPIQKKIGVITIFGMGIFVIVAAILNKVYSTLPSLLNDSVNYTFWYMREATVSVYVINLPQLWPALRKLFPLLTGRGSSAGSRGNTSHTGSRPWLASRKRTQIDSKGEDDGFEMKNRGHGGDGEDSSIGELGRSEYNTSQERIIENGHGNGKKDFFSSPKVLEIKRDITFSVEESSGYTQYPISSTNEGDGVNKSVGGYQTTIHTRSPMERRKE